jgi:hypothetical protein
MENIRVTKGIARYTSSFAPPGAFWYIFIKLQTRLKYGGFLLYLIDLFKYYL